jgi:hypothetical protein
MSVGYFNYLRTCDLCLKKTASPKESNRLPGELLTGESITNTNNSMNIQKNYKSFMDVPIGISRNCFKKKTGDEKPRDTVPLMIFLQ